MSPDQLALPTSAMSLEEAVADQCDAFDEAVRRLEEEALLEAELDDEANVDPEFFPLVRADDSGSDSEWEAL